MKKLLCKSLLLACLFLPINALRAQCNQTYENDVRRQLLNSPYIERLLNAGYIITHDVTFVGLYAGNWKSYTINLDAGNNYRITGRCDRDCQDLDLKLYDGFGNLIAKDLDSDDYPAISIDCWRSGRFTLHVRAYSCSSPPCCTGIVILGK